MKVTVGSVAGPLENGGQVYTFYKLTGMQL